MWAKLWFVARQEQYLHPSKSIMNIDTAPNENTAPPDSANSSEAFLLPFTASNDVITDLSHTLIAKLSGSTNVYRKMGIKTVTLVLFFLI